MYKQEILKFIYNFNIMKFDIVTIFPKIFDSYFGESILGRAQKEKLIDIKIYNLRDYTTDKHQTVDDTPYGGGPGMVMKVDPIFNCVKAIKNNFNNEVLNKKTKKSNSKIILFSAKGKRYTQRDAERLAKYDNLILICGRYEGVDERVTEYIADEEISIGDYVLTGGEVPAMALVDSVSRLIPEVLGNMKSLEEESYTIHSSKSENNNSILDMDINKEYPQYTRPEKFNNWNVPKVLLSGNHKKIKNWREEH